MGFEIISYKFVAAGMLTAAKTYLYSMTPARDSAEPQRHGVESQDTGGGVSIGVTTPENALGKFFEVSLSLGKTEAANDIRMEEAVCSVSKSKIIVKTALVGLKGTIKEYISDGDFEINISVGLVAVENGVIVDKYPAEGVQDLRQLLDHNEALYVDSEFLHLFDITRLVVVDYQIEQMTHSNRQIVTIRAISDEDYVIKCNEY